MSYAIIQTGGKQYKVKSGEILKIEKLTDSKPDSKIEFKEVLAYGIGFALSPLLGTLVAHLIAIKLFAKKAKKQSFFNNDFYYGFFGILAVSYFSLLFPVN